MKSSYKYLDLTERAGGHGGRTGLFDIGGNRPGAPHLCRCATMRGNGRLMGLLRLARYLIVYCLIAGPLLTGLARAQDFTYTNTNGTITITGYIGPGGNVAIPDTLSGLPVTSIGDQAFSYLTNLTGVTIPDSVTNLGNAAFLACTNLALLSIGKGITTIKGGSDTSWFGTFAGCTSLTNLTIPGTVTNLGDGVPTKGGSLGAFAGCYGLTNVILEDGVAYIGDGTFASCTSLMRVTIPDSVTTVGDFAFNYCEALNEVKIGKGVTQLGPGMGYAFAGCENLTSILIPANVTNLGNYTFEECVALANLAIEDGVARIGNHTFHYCQSLTNVTLPASVTAIDDEAFAYCTNLEGVYFKGNAPATNPPPWGGGVFYYSTNVTVYYLPGTTGWGETFAGRPTMLWNPQAQTADAAFGVQQNQFGFNVTGTPNIPLVVEASTDLAAASWLSLQSCTLTNGLIYFSDPQWTNHPRRFYRIRSP